jgi:hypothetical protein
MSSTVSSTPTFSAGLTPPEQTTSVDALMKAVNVQTPPNGATTPQKPAGVLTQKATTVPRTLRQGDSTKAKDLGVAIEVRAAGVSGPRAKGLGAQAKVTYTKPLNKDTSWTTAFAVATNHGNAPNPVNARTFSLRTGVTHKIAIDPRSTLSVGASVGGSLVYNKDGKGNGPLSSDSFSFDVSPSAKITHILMNGKSTKISVFGEFVPKLSFSGNGTAPISAQIQPKGTLGIQADFDTNKNRKGNELSLTATASMEYRIGLNGATAGDLVGVIPSLGFEAKYKVSDNFLLFGNIGLTVGNAKSLNSSDFLGSTNEGFRGGMGVQFNF